MSMLRYLSPVGRPSAQRTSSHHGAASPRPDKHDKHGAPKLHLHVPNYGIIIMPAPEAPEHDGLTGEGSEPRSDHMIHGELEISLPPLSHPRKCKAIRVGIRTVIKLDMGQGRKDEEDVLFERKVEMIGANSDGILLNPGSQRFAFTLILPCNLAPHDWHPNGVLAHNLYAELEGKPVEHEWGLKSVSSSTSLFSFRQGGKKSPTSRSQSRAASPSRRGRSTLQSAVQSMPTTRPPSIPPSGTTTPVGMDSAAPPHVLAGALANLNLNPNGHAELGPPAGPPAGGGNGVNPAYLSAAQSLSITRQESLALPQTPPYELARNDSSNRLSAMSADHTPPADWLHGNTRVDRRCMIVYNPNPGGTSTDLDDSATGYVNGLGVWDLSMTADVWSIGALMRLKVKISAIPDTATIFAARLLLAQSHTIISPRDEEGDSNKIASTRHFTIAEAGKRPPPGHAHPDHHYPALWRGAAVPSGKDKPGKEKPPSSGDLLIDVKGRLPSDIVARPSSLPGVITPIHVSHNLVLEVFFTVWAEDDRGGKMRIPGPGGLRMLRVSRPAIVPSCCLVPAVIDLPRYEDHEKDKMAPLTPDVLQKNFILAEDQDWDICACGMKVEDMEVRMRDQAVAEAQQTGTSLADMAASAAAEDKVWMERGRRQRQRGSV